MLAIAAACWAAAMASENRPFSAYAAASVRRNCGSLPPESATACWAKPIAFAPSRIEPSEDVASTHAMLLRECGSSGANTNAVLVLGDRLLERPLPQKSITKAGVGVRVIRLYQEALLQIRNCFIDSAFCKKNVSAVVIGICIIRFQFNSLFIVNHRLIRFSFSGQSIREIHFDESRAHVVVSVGLIRSDPRRSCEVRNRVIQFSAIEPVDMQDCCGRNRSRMLQQEHESKGSRCYANTKSEQTLPMPGQ